MFCSLLTRADVALAVARACSPRVRAFATGAVFDVSGCSRTIGPPDTIAREVYALAKRWSAPVPSGPESGEPPRVAVAPTVTMAWILAHALSGVTTVSDAGLLARLPVGWLGCLEGLTAGTPAVEPRARTSAARVKHAAAAARSYRDVLAIFERWGLRTLGDVAALPRADILSRLGPAGRRLHEAASGEDDGPFVPMDDPPVFADRQELDWPIEGLEPLAFVLSRSCERLSLLLQRADRGAVVVRTDLRLVTRDTHTRTLNLPSPMADPRILRTLILLDLESHPPPAAIDIVTIAVDVSPGPIAQGSLIAPTLPTPEDLATLLARLTALAGDTRVGTPAVPDSHDPRAVGMGVFRATEDQAGAACASPPAPPATVRRPTLRRLRIPVAARVEIARRLPAHVRPSARGLAGGRVVACAGPWRTSGGWWTVAGSEWDRDEWDVELATGDVYRIARDRSTDQWVVEGLLD